MNTAVQKFNNKWEEKDARNRSQLNAAFHTHIENGEADKLTVRGLCISAGVSTGSFYNLYTSFEDFRSQYIFEDFKAYYTDTYKNTNELGSVNALKKLCNIYICYAEYCMLKGKKFVGSFYRPFSTGYYFSSYKNQKEQTMYRSIFDDIIRYICDAQKTGLINPSYNAKYYCMQLHMIMTGIIFNWCSGALKDDIVNIVQSSMETALNVGFFDTNYEILKKYVTF